MRSGFLLFLRSDIHCAFSFSNWLVYQCGSSGQEHVVKYEYGKKKHERYDILAKFLAVMFYVPKFSAFVTFVSQKSPKYTS